jgi:riboflavin kinase
VTSLYGRVTAGTGQAAGFMARPWVRDGVRDALGFDPYPGTLNLRLLDADTVLRWGEIQKRAALRLAPPAAEQCGGVLVPLVVAPDVPAAVIVPDITRYEGDILEVIAAVHLRSRLRLRDGSVLALRCQDDGISAGAGPRGVPAPTTPLPQTR